jgi:predicted transcriptional regulator YdeE
VGISTIVSNENPEGIATLWDRFYSGNISEHIKNKSSGNVIAVYTRYQGDYTKPYTVIIGHEVNGDDFLYDSQLDCVDINNKNHTKYTVTGKLPEVFVNKWREIWGSGHQRAYISDYDIYYPDGSVEICVEFSKNLIN